jgi:hypothetical protein
VARIMPNARVVMKSAAMRTLRFPPPSPELVIAVHRAALRATGNTLTLAAHVSHASITWVGAVDERMLDVAEGTASEDARKLISTCLVTGPCLWHCIAPGPLLAVPSAGPTTVYGGSRPWLVVGRLETGVVLAVPVNDARGQEKWYAPHIPAGALPTPEAKDSQIELAHLWSLPAGWRDIGILEAGQRSALGEAVKKYYG